MKLKPRERTMIAVLAVVAVLGLYAFLHPAAVVNPLAKATPSPQTEPIPRIDLARLDKPRPEVELGRRDIFAYGPPPTQPPPPPTVATPPPVTMAPMPVSTMPAVPRPAALNLKYIGSVESAKGLKVAVLMTDRNEILTGQAGEVLANRYRIARIGMESVDLEEVGSGQVRRLPMRANN